MAAIIIVTKQCYLLAESINYISVHEMSEDEKDDSLLWSAPAKSRRGRKKLTPKQKLLESLKKQAQLYQISINFVPAHQVQQNHNSRNGDQTDQVNITVRGYDRCLELYRDMIDQIREQQPDKLFLDKLVEKFLSTHQVNQEET